MPYSIIFILILAILFLASAIRILKEYERGVIFRLGRVIGAKGPGLIFLVPFGVERMRKMDLRIVALDIPPQDTITKDNVSVTVNAVAAHHEEVQPDSLYAILACAADAISSSRIWARWKARKCSQCSRSSGPGFITPPSPMIAAQSVCSAWRAASGPVEATC